MEVLEVREHHLAQMEETARLSWEAMEELEVVERHMVEGAGAVQVAPDSS